MISDGDALVLLTELGRQIEDCNVSDYEAIFIGDAVTIGGELVPSDVAKTDVAKANVYGENSVHISCEKATGKPLCEHAELSVTEVVVESVANYKGEGKVNPISIGHSNCQVAHCELVRVPNYNESTAKRLG